MTTNSVIKTVQRKFSCIRGRWKCTFRWMVTIPWGSVLG